MTEIRYFAILLSLNLASCVTTELVPSVTEELAVSLLEKNGGFTVDLSGKSLSGSGLFAVSPYPERSRKFDVRPTAGDVARYIEVNKDLFALPHRNLGGWCEGKLNSPPCYLDVSLALDSEVSAVILGRNCNQQSIAQLTPEVRFISTGGDGNAIFGEDLDRCKRSIAEFVP